MATADLLPASQPGDANLQPQSAIENTSSGLHQRIRRPKALWAISVPIFLAANILDAHSSWSKPESNHLLQGQGGRFDSGSLAIKFAISAGVIFADYSLIRKFRHDPEFQTCAYNAGAWSNFIGAGALTVTAARNYRTAAAGVHPR